MKKILVAIAAALAMFGAACGGTGDADTTNPAALEDVSVSECVTAPVTVGGISVLGQRVEGISDVKVCVDASARADVAPQVIEQPDCGSPCFTVEVRNLDIAADQKIEVSMKRDGKDVPPITFDPQPVNPTEEEQTGRICVLGYGGPPDPCAERLTTPKSLTVTAGKTKATLSWRASVDTGDGDITGYEIWRSTSGEDLSFAYVTTVPDVSAVDTGLTRKTQYWYYVVALDADGHRSEASEVATATTR
jgi:hypothetical protein